MIVECSICGRKADADTMEIDCPIDVVGYSCGADGHRVTYYLSLGAKDLRARAVRHLLNRYDYLIGQCMAPSVDRETYVARNLNATCRNLRNGMTPRADGSGYDGSAVIEIGRLRVLVWDSGKAEVYRGRRKLGVWWVHPTSDNWTPERIASVAVDAATNRASEFSARIQP